MSSKRLKVQVWIHRQNSSGQREILLLLLKPERGGYWQPVTGGVDSGEKLSKAALREASEETALPFQAQPVELGYSFRFESRGHEYEEHAFALEAPSKGIVRTDPVEHVDHRWVLAHQVTKEELKHPSNAEGLKSLLKYLSEFSGFTPPT